MSEQSPSPSELRFAVLATDTILFTIRDGTLLVRVTEVNRPPFYTHARAFPGGLIHADETAEDAAARILREKSHIAVAKVHLEQLYTFSAIDRDPRGRVVAVAYLGLVPWDLLSEAERADDADAAWVPVSRATQLAYDHDAMLRVALMRLRSRVTYTTLISKLMPQEFTLTELELAYECILKTDLDKRNFRKKILKLHILKPLNKKRIAGRSRPAELYRFGSPVIQDIEVL
jgi:8-oxo-dGTP diphosphatase